MTTHLCPIGDADLTPCCDRSPFELPMLDRITQDMRGVTCGNVPLHGADVTCGKCGKRVETGRIHACTGMLQSVA